MLFNRKVRARVYKRALNFCSGTITSCFEIIVTSSLYLKVVFTTRPRHSRYCPYFPSFFTFCYIKVTP